MRKEAKGYLYVVLGATFLGTIGIAARFIYRQEPDPLTVVTYRALIAFLALLITAIVVNPNWLRIRKKDFLFFAVYGLLSVSLCFLLFLYAIKYTSVATATILLYTYPAFVVIFSRLFLDEEFTRSMIRRRSSPTSRECCMVWERDWAPGFTASSARKAFPGTVPSPWSLTLWASEASSSC